MIFSADGAAAVAGRVKALTCPADQYLLRHLRGYADAVLVGGATARAEGYGPIRLSAEQQRQRLAAGRPHPQLAVVSLTGRLPQTLHSPSREPPILITSRAAAARNELQTDPRHQVLIAGDHRVEIATALDLLRQAGIHRILCEGGPTLLDEIVRADLLDEICVTIAPKLAGNQCVGQSSAPSIAVPVDLRIRHAVIHDGYVFLRYARC